MQISNKISLLYNLSQDMQLNPLFIFFIITQRFCGIVPKKIRNKISAKIRNCFKKSQSKSKNTKKKKTIKAMQLKKKIYYS